MTQAAPSVCQRLLMLGPKIRERGLRWAVRRLAVEIGSPTTIFGRILRPVVMPVYGLTTARDQNPPRNSDTLLFFYDLNANPITYNAVDALVAAELARRRCGAVRLHVVVVPGHEQGLRYEDAEYEAVVNRDARLWRLHHMLVPLFSLIPSCSGYTICSTRAEASAILTQAAGIVFPEGYRTEFPVSLARRDIFDAVRGGEAMWPALAAPEVARQTVRRWLEARGGNRRAIVVTLRQYAYMTGRNSRVDDWAAFLTSLDESVYFPVVIPDTDLASEIAIPKLSRFATFPEAAWNVALRLALYEQAWLNMAVVHGPTELCWYSERCRYLLFMEMDTAPQTSRELLAADGFDVGGQLPWATLYQRWVWAGDTESVLGCEFREMAKLLERAHTD